MALRYLTARLAQKIDEELMGSGAFSLDQLMELAGLACAQTLARVYPRDTHPRVLVCCGPGNQGGDGLVAARHLAHFGYKITVFMPKPGHKDIYNRLLTQCSKMHIPELGDERNTFPFLQTALQTNNVILDAIFGFSFKPPVRPPFDTVLSSLASSRLPIVSVDIPSGWDVEEGRIPISMKSTEGVESTFEGLEPDVLISLTAPKLGTKAFKGRHFLGGRFVSKEIEEQYQLNLPEYPGYDQIVELSQSQKL